jgi:putative tryptophan/tyrosine transport system substrate-binding protein
MMDRRIFVKLLGAGVLSTPLGAFAQSPNKIRKIGILNVLPRDAPLPQAVLSGLRDLGYVEGKNIIIEYRSGTYGQFPALADELVRLKVDVIYAVLDQAALAASKATTTIPIVFVVIGDPVRSGLVASLAHPGGNVTGLTAFGSDLGGKRLELLKELIPRLTHIGVLWNPATATRPGQLGLEQTEEAGRALGVRVQSFPAQSSSDLSDALEGAMRERIGALIVEEDSLTYSERNRIIEFAAVHELPAIYGYRDYVVSGGLISYGAKLPELMRQALARIDKVLKGARPGDLPVEQPTNFELVLNSKTAKALGIVIPQSVLLRANEVIQ